MLIAIFGTAPVRSPVPALVWAGVLIGVVMLAGAGIMLARRRLLGGDRTNPAEGLFEDLRRMHREGRLTQQEYDAARKNLAKGIAGHATGVSGSADRRT
ncbi:MAG: hypothetical protein JNM07_01760 [Phycisphaerae bacterium]|nr:hypothetical protein [Phycisphaerae bacterium]